MPHNHDSDGLASHTCCLSPYEARIRRAEQLAMHRRWLEKQAPIQARDRKWRRVAQTVLGLIAMAVLGLLIAVLYALWQFMNGGSLDWVEGVAGKIRLSSVSLALMIARMMYAWHKRRGGSTVARGVDVAVSILPNR